MTEIVIFGTGSFAEVAYRYLTTDSEYDVVAFTADEEYIQNETLLGCPVVVFKEVAAEYPPSEYDMFVAIAYTNMNHLRTQTCQRAKKCGYDLVSYVASDVDLWDGVNIGENCFIFEDQTVQPFVEIGNNVILWSGNHLGHHSTIESNCFVASQAVISGHVTIGEYSFVGVNATITDGVTIADHSLVGAQALITKDTEQGGVYAGNEASLRGSESREFL